MLMLMLVLIGIGCDIGGYVGDVLLFVWLLVVVSGCLIIYFNVMNGVLLYWSDFCVFYVEGYGFDWFVVGDWVLWLV